MGSADLLLIFGVFLAAVAVYTFTSAMLTNNNDNEMLVWASGNEPAKSKNPLINFSRPLVHVFTIQHAIRIKSPDYRKRVAKILLTAGLSRELNVDEFIGLQILWAILVSGFVAFLNYGLDLELPWLFCLLGIPLGAMVPRIYASSEKGRREMSVRADLPFFADLLALSTEAGLDFIAAIQKIVDKASDSVLAQELGTVLQDIKLGSARADALKGLSTRLDIGDITSFVAVLVDADATGASISKVLKDQSNQIRLERFVRAEKAGARASQIMLVPMMLFIMPAVMLVVFGPVIVSFYYGGK